MATAVVIALGITLIVVARLVARSESPWVSVDKTWSGEARPSIDLQPGRLTRLGVEVPVDGVSRVDLPIQLSTSNREGAATRPALTATLRSAESEVLWHSDYELQPDVIDQMLSISFPTVPFQDGSDVTLELAPHPDFEGRASLLAVACDCEGSVVHVSPQSPSKTRPTTIAAQLFRYAPDTLARVRIAFRRQSAVSPLGWGGTAVMVSAVATLLLFLVTLWICIDLALRNWSVSGRRE